MVLGRRAAVAAAVGATAGHRVAGVPRGRRRRPAVGAPGLRDRDRDPRRRVPAAGLLLGRRCSERARRQPRGPRVAARAELAPRAPLHRPRSWSTCRSGVLTVAAGRPIVRAEPRPRGPAGLARRDGAGRARHRRVPAAPSTARCADALERCAADARGRVREEIVAARRAGRPADRASRSRRSCTARTSWRGSS